MTAGSSIGEATGPARAGAIDLIVSDIDGCLQPESNSAMDLESLARIAAWNGAAVKHRDRPMVTMCSGRPQPFAEAMCKLIGNLHVPCVAENGVWLYHPGSNEYSMDPSITASHRAAVHEAAKWLDREFGPRGVSQQPGKVASISLHHTDTRVLKEIGPRIEREFAERGWPLRVSMTWLYINCDLKHVSKGTGMRRLLATVGLPRERVAGIGDTMSDLAIREHVGWFACPANAADEIKRHADFVAEQPEARGVVEILERIAAGFGRVA
jgi:hydroxymethylpyrimidine pyrophosphatase-like HAD family hydrolase